MRRIAALARLELTPEETRTLGAEFAHILAAFRTLEQAAVDGIEPLTSLGSSAELREDTLQPGLAREELLARAPEVSPGPEGGEPRFFRVPPAIVGRASAAPDPEPRP